MTETWDFKDRSCARSPAITQGLSYWHSKCIGNAVPGRAQIDPAEMLAFLPKVILIDIEGESDFIFRLFGTEISARNSRDLTGRRADETTLGPSVGRFIEAYHRCIGARQPIFFVGDLGWQNRRHITFEQIILPLYSDGSRIDKLLCIVDFDLPEQP